MMICGSVYMIGSISPYLASYYQVSTGQSLLLLPVQTVLTTIIMPFGAQFAERFQGKTVLAMGGTIASLCALAASFVPRGSFPVFAFFLAGGMGLVIGLSYTSPIRLGWQAMPARSGLVSGLIIGGFGLGSLIFTALGSMIVNPENMGQIRAIETSTGREIDVFPEQVALRVPLFLRWLAFSYAVITVVAQILTRAEIKAPTTAPDHLEEEPRRRDSTGGSELHDDESNADDFISDYNEYSRGEELQQQDNYSSGKNSKSFGRNVMADEKTDDHFWRVGSDQSQINDDAGYYDIGAKTTQSSE